MFRDEVMYFELAKTGEFEDLKKLIESGDFTANDCNLTGITPLHFAAERGDVDMAAYLVENGADVNAYDDAGWRPIHVAASHDKTDFVSFLVEKVFSCFLSSSYFFW